LISFRGSRQSCDCTKKHLAVRYRKYEGKLGVTMLDRVQSGSVEGAMNARMTANEFEED
jgi:hypothetical protein